MRLCSPLAFLCLFVPATLCASLLPEQHQLAEAQNRTLLKKTHFSQWLELHSTAWVHQKNRFTQNTAAFTDEDALSQHFARLYYQKSVLSKNEKTQLAAALLDARQQYLERMQKPHPLDPYLVALAYENSEAALPQATYLQNLRQDGLGMNCPTVAYLRARLTDKLFITTQVRPTQGLLQTLSHSNNPRLLKETLKTFLYLLPAEQKPLYQKDVQALMQAHPLLKEALASSFLLPSPHSRQGKPPAQPSSLLSQAGQAAIKGDCNQAKMTLLQALQEPSSKLAPQPTAWKVLQRVGDCFRSRSGASQRLQAWQELTGPMSAAYGYPAWVQTHLELARFHWAQDHFDEAHSLLQRLWERSSQEQDRQTQSEVLYLEGVIYENQKEFDTAVQKYTAYLQTQPQSPQREQALMALMITFAGLQRWKDSLTMAQQLILLQDELPHDERHVSIMGAALFWGGRSAIELGQTPLGLAYWQRAAAEFFSTYYGAIGHYMLEKFTGKHYALQPLINQPFSPTLMLNAFAGPEQQRIERILLLLRLGLKNEASCEISELAAQESEQAQQLTRALLLYAADQWLEAIRIYGNLSRSFRKSLPYGMESLLFPRRYEASINYYAKKIGLDPDFIFSLIRQESVFNPNAHSGAGAMGLMQLMGKTAHTEAKRLPHNYVSSADKNMLIQKIKHSQALYETDTNIILGVHYLNHLIQRYDHIPLSLAAYNAGPTVTSKWVKKYNIDDPLYFIERIPYRETRDYVRLILRNYFYYKKWYRGEFDPLPHLDQLTANLSLLSKTQRGIVKN